MDSYTNDVALKLLQIEEELDLLEKQIDGVFFWERIRFSVYSTILTQTGVVGQAHTKISPNIINRASSLFNAVKNMFHKNPFLAPRSDILFFGSPRRKLGEDKKWYDIYCDPLIETISYSYVYVEKPYIGKHLTPAATTGIRYLDLVIYLGTILRKLKLVKHELKNEDTKLLEKVKKNLDSKFGIELDLHNLIKSDLLIRKSQLPVFKLLIKRVHPKLIILVCSYGNETFIEAGKAMGVPVAELQHGLISRSHMGYHYPGQKHRKHVFPDYLLTFGDYWNTTVDFPIGKEQVISVGYPYMEKEIKECEVYTKKEQIVFISQGTVGAALSRIALELSEIESFPYDIVYKLHPGEYARWRKEYPWLTGSTVMVVDDESYPLYKVFTESKVQVGVSSTAIFEGLAFGLRTILVPLGVGLESMQVLIENNMAVECKTVGEIIDAVEKSDANIVVEIDKIFKRNALDNISCFLDSVLD